MQCPYCKDEVIDGATVCRSCGRKQPLTAKARGDLMLLLVGGGFALVILSLLGISMWMDYQKNSAIDRVVAAAQLCGKSQTMDRVMVTYELEQMHDKGVSWHDGEKLLLFDACGSITSD